MLLCLLDNLSPNTIDHRIYSIATVEEKIGGNIYRIRYKGSEYRLCSNVPIESNKWVRFHGRYNGNMIICDFIEILEGIDINLLIKCIERLSL